MYDVAFSGENPGGAFASLYNAIVGIPDAGIVTGYPIGHQTRRFASSSSDSDSIASPLRDDPPPAPETPESPEERLRRERTAWVTETLPQACVREFYRRPLPTTSTDSMVEHNAIFLRYRTELEKQRFPQETPEMRATRLQDEREQFRTNVLNSIKGTASYNRYRAQRTDKDARGHKNTTYGCGTGTVACGGGSTACGLTHYSMCCMGTLAAMGGLGLLCTIYEFRNWYRKTRESDTYRQAAQHNGAFYHLFAQATQNEPPSTAPTASAMQSPPIPEGPPLR